MALHSRKAQSDSLTPPSLPKSIDIGDVTVDDKCDPIRSELAILEKQLLLIDKFLVEPEPGEPHPPHPVLNPEWKKKDAQVRSKRSALAVCENPSLQTAINPMIQLQNLRVEQAQEDGIFSDGDEPYLVTLGFRSRFRSAGTTSVFWSGDLYELGHLDSGDSVSMCGLS